MDFSDSIGDSGNLRLSKVLRLARVLWRIIVVRYSDANCRTVYYPPSGATRASLFRDVLILGLTRRLFPRIIFHFHASGLSDSYATRSKLERWLIRRTYGRPDAAVTLSPLAPKEGRFCEALTEFIIPNGVPDPYSDQPDRGDALRGATPPVVLFVGIVGHPKGAVRLLEAASMLSASGCDFQVKLVGDVDHALGKAQLSRIIDDLDLESRTELCGVLTGEDKHLAYETADIMCFPSLFEHETFPLVLLEAQAHRLPVVSSDWRAIPDIVTHGEDGFLATQADANETARFLRLLIDDPDLRRSMGQNARQSYERRFRIETFQSKICSAIESVAEGGFIACLNS